MKLARVLFPALLPVCLTTLACGSNVAQQANADDDDYDQEELALFRAAIPEESRLAAATPAPGADPMALTSRGNAALAPLAVKGASTINGPVKAIVSTLKALTKVPPTSYDSAKQQFVWGPMDNEDGYGNVLAYIQKHPEDSNFDFAYALVRLEGNDLSTAVPVIWGGASPLTKPDEDGDSSGTGVTLWDFEANRAFEQSHDPDFDPTASVDRGRFAMLFGRRDDTAARFRFNVAVFRNFISKGAQQPDPVNLDFFFGHYRGADTPTVDFVDWALDADLCDSGVDTCFDEKSDANNAQERLGFRAAFFDRAAGRAEAVVSGGDLDSVVDVDECWDADINRTHVSVSVAGTTVVEDGACDSPFDQTLDELSIPKLQDVDADLMTRLSCVAESGAACDRR